MLDSAIQAAGWDAALATLPRVLIYGFAALLGLALGSFLNVVIHRLPRMLIADDAGEAAETERDGGRYAGIRDDSRGNADAAGTEGAASGHRQALGHRAAAPSATDHGRTGRYDLCYPPSSCPQCAHRLRIRDNIPVLSYLLLRGRCAYCHARISAAYPCIEIATALLAILCVWQFGLSFHAVAGFGLGCTLLALAVIDARHFLLPDSLTLPLVWAGLLVNATETFSDLHSAVIGAAAGYVSLWLVYWAFLLLRKKEGLGYGDFKMLAAIGAWFGWQCLPMVTLVAALTGSVFGIVLAVRGHRSRNAPIPFGIFLAFGAACQLFGWLPAFP